MLKKYYRETQRKDKIIRREFVLLCDEKQCAPNHISLEDAEAWKINVLYAENPKRRMI